MAAVAALTFCFLEEIFKHVGWLVFAYVYLHDKFIVMDMSAEDRGILYSIV